MGYPRKSQSREENAQQDKDGALVELAAQANHASMAQKVASAIRRSLLENVLAITTRSLESVRAISIKRNPA